MDNAPVQLTLQLELAHRRIRRESVHQRVDTASDTSYNAGVDETRNIMPKQPSTDSDVSVLFMQIMLPNIFAPASPSMKPRMFKLTI